MEPVEDSSRHGDARAAHRRARLQPFEEQGASARVAREHAGGRVRAPVAQRPSLGPHGIGPQRQLQHRAAVRGIAAEDDGAPAAGQDVSEAQLPLLDQRRKPLRQRGMPGRRGVAEGRVDVGFDRGWDHDRLRQPGLVLAQPVDVASGSLRRPAASSPATTVAASATR